MTLGFNIGDTIEIDYQFWAKTNPYKIKSVRRGNPPMITLVDCNGNKRVIRHITAAWKCARKVS